MRNIGIAAAVAAAILLTPVSTKPARADATLTAAIVAGVITLVTLKCTDTQDKNTQEFLCIFPPPQTKNAVVTGSALLPKASPPPKTSFLFNNSIKVVQALHPKVNYVILPERPRVVAAIKKMPPDTTSVH
jgi:hypothetical protein